MTNDLNLFVARFLKDIKAYPTKITYYIVSNFTISGYNKANKNALPKSANLFPDFHVEGTIHTTVEIKNGKKATPNSINQLR